MLKLSDAVEQWKPVVGWEGLYEVSSHGRVRSLSRLRKSSWNGKVHFINSLSGRVLSPLSHEGQGGRSRVVLYRDGKQHKVFISRLVAAAFLGPGNGQIVRHWNDDQSNDRLSNLKYGTFKDNGEDAVRNGKSTRGSRNAMCKLTEENVREIRRLLSLGQSCPQVAAMVGLSRNTIQDIKTRRIWGWLD